MSNLMVSIICTSYNYAEFIERAIDSFLAQEVDFPYEIILVDDCSTDNSRAIIQSYAQKHPDLIRVLEPGLISVRRLEASTLLVVMLTITGSIPKSCRSK